jgi:hypothetical protein
MDRKEGIGGIRDDGRGYRGKNEEEEERRRSRRGRLVMEVGKG